MRIKPAVSLGFQCPICGNIQQQTLSIFGVSSAGLEICCTSCRKPYATVVRTGNRVYTITASCLDCFEQHRYKVKSGELWFSQLKEFDCPHSGDANFLIGKASAVAKELEELFAPDDSAFDTAMTEFVMQTGRSDAIELAEAIKHITDLSAQGKITCSCGEIYIQLELLENDLRLSCPTCQSTLMLDVSDEENINIVKKMKSIKIK